MVSYALTSLESTDEGLDLGCQQFNAERNGNLSWRTSQGGAPRDG